MATFGNSSTPSFGWFEYGINTTNGVASLLSVPSPGGWITDIHAYFSTFTGTGTCYVVLWDGGGNILGSVAVSVGTGSASAGGQDWHGGTLSTPVFVKTGVSVYIGFEVPQANGLITSFYSSGSSVNGQNSSIPFSISGWASSGHGTIGAYATYSAGGGAWVARPGFGQAPAYVRRAGVWTPAYCYVMRSGVWTLSS